MWLAFLGGGLILSVCIMTGNQKALELKKREQQLAAFAGLCNAIETEIAYGQTPLPQIFLRQGKHLSYPLGSICQMTGNSLSQGGGVVLDTVWREALLTYEAALYLTGEDREIIESLSSELGLSYSNEQIKKLQLLRLRLEQQERLAREEQQKMGKVWQALGWCSGSMLILLFL